MSLEPTYPSSWSRQTPENQLKLHLLLLADSAKALAKTNPTNSMTLTEKIDRVSSAINDESKGLLSVSELALEVFQLMDMFLCAFIEDRTPATDRYRKKSRQLNDVAEDNKERGQIQFEKLQETINMLAEENPTWNLTKLRKETAKRVKKSNGSPYSASYLQKIGLNPKK